MKLWVITEVKYSNEPDATPDDFLNVVHAVAGSPGNVVAIIKELRTKIAPEKNKVTAPIRSIPAMGSAGWVCEFSDNHYLRALPAELDQIISYRSGPVEKTEPQPKQFEVWRFSDGTYGRFFWGKDPDGNLSLDAMSAGERPLHLIWAAWRDDNEREPVAKVGDTQRRPGEVSR